MFVGIDRTSKFAVTQLVDKADRKTAWEFLQHMLEAVPCQVHTILTDRAIGTPLVRETMARGIQFAEQPRNRNTIYSRPMRFDMICEAIGIEHRLTRPNHPWTNGQVERMNRKGQGGNREAFPLRQPRPAASTSDGLHLASGPTVHWTVGLSLLTYNFARRLKTLSGLTPYEYICKI